MSSYFSQLRLRILNVISPATTINGDGERSGQQSTVERTLGGRVARKRTKKTEEKNLKHMVIAAHENEGTEGEGDSVNIHGSTNGAPSRLLSKTPTPGRRPAGASRTPQIFVTPASKREDDRSEYGLPTLKLSITKQVEETLHIEADEGTRYIDITKRSHPHWSQSEINLFNKLNNRGFETMLPSSFKMDFPTVPLSLFTDRIDKTFINSLSGNDFRASRALLVLFPLGARARDRRMNNLSPEPFITRAITSYIKWSHTDAGLDQRDPIPTLAVCCASKGETINSVIARTEAELRELGSQYRDEFRVVPSDETEKSAKRTENVLEMDNDERTVNESKTSALRHSLPPTPSTTTSSAASPTTKYFNPPLPTIFGFAVYHMIVALFSYNSSDEDKGLRTLALFDFGNEDQDVWNSFALAMTIVWVRNYHVSLDWPLVEPEPESDMDV